MIQRLGSSLTRISHRYLPDPFIFAILLSILVFIMGILLTNQTPFEMVIHWQQGFWNLLTFSMQMALIIVFGYAVADSPLVNRWLKALADSAKTSRQAVYIVAMVATLGGLVSWGFGLVLGALFAKEMGRSGFRRGIKMHYPLLGAAAYLAMLVWGAGLSSSAPLLVATEGHFLQDKIGIISIAQTLFNPMNIKVIIAQIILIPIFAVLVHPKDERELLPIDSCLSQEQMAATAELESTAVMQDPTPATRLDNSRILTWIVGIGGLSYVFYHFATKGFDLNLNILNAIFLFVGFLLHGTPMKYIKSVAEGTKGVSGVLLQFPFYAGIMGMMGSSGLVSLIANWFIDISSPVTYPLYTFISAAIVNLFVPSGGGQWAVQGPIMIEAAPALGVSIEKTIMAIAYGDQLTNMLQPFWAIALLGITGLKARQIVGYTAVIMFLAFWIYAIAVFLPA